jgi:acetylornithine deacetylase/succinyl-diaminopimelate desuccinylase-like protein
VAARFGPEGDDGIVLFASVVVQHGDPRDDTPTVIGNGGAMQVRGWGATPCKGVFASALAALSGLPELRRPVWLAVSTEGSSSHGGSRRLLDDLDLRASAGIVLTGTDLAISRANRGRIDVVIRIRGETCHSSQPSLGSNPFDRLPEILDLLRRLVTPPEGRTLGLATVTPFAIRHSPFAIRHSPFAIRHSSRAGARHPPLIPQALFVCVDRRLLPGESPDVAIASV